MHLAPERADIHYEMGVTLLGVGRIGEALEEFRAASTMAPCQVDSRRALARLAAGAQEWLGAAAQWNPVLAWEPNDKEALAGLERATPGNVP